MWPYRTTSDIMDKGVWTLRTIETVHCRMIIRHHTGLNVAFVNRKKANARLNYTNFDVSSEMKPWICYRCPQPPPTRGAFVSTTNHHPVFFSTYRRQEGRTLVFVFGSDNGKLRVTYNVRFVLSTLGGVLVTFKCLLPCLDAIPGKVTDALTHSTFK